MMNTEDRQVMHALLQVIDRAELEIAQASSIINSEALLVNGEVVNTVKIHQQVGRIEKATGAIDIAKRRLRQLQDPNCDGYPTCQGCSCWTRDDNPSVDQSVVLEDFCSHPDVQIISKNGRSLVLNMLEDDRPDWCPLLKDKVKVYVGGQLVINGRATSTTNYTKRTNKLHVEDKDQGYEVQVPKEVGNDEEKVCCSDE